MRPYGLGYDFNRKTLTRSFGRVLDSQVEEFHVDGYRVDLSKGLPQTNTLGDIVRGMATTRGKLTSCLFKPRLDPPSGSYMIWTLGTTRKKRPWPMGFLL